MKNKGFKVTVEFECPDMISEDDFLEEFNNDPMSAYRFISDNLSDSPGNFSSKERVLKVETI